MSGIEGPTFAGPGFGTLVDTDDGARPGAPRVVTRREGLRAGLPLIYRQEDFSMRFVGAFERVLDPVVALLDSMPDHLRPALAPADLLGLLGAWLGATLDEAQPLAERREVVRRAADLGRVRGTAAGLALALRLAFPDLDLVVDDAGGVTWSADGTPPAAGRPPGFVVRCDVAVPHERQAAIARVIDEEKPVGIPYRLRVRGGPTKEDA
jgi:phage tail-like protein